MPRGSFNDFGYEPNVFESLSDDPEAAFLTLEKKFRADCDAFVSNANENEDTRVAYLEYMASVLAAISELGLEARFNGALPDIQEVDYQTYVNFSKNVRHLTVQLEIRGSRRQAGFSVRFDETARQKIRHFIAQIREVVGKLEIDNNKRDALTSKIRALESEVDRERTHLQAYGDLVIEAASDVGEAADKLGPVRRILDSISKVIYGTREEQAEQKQLPNPPHPKRIEPPKPKKDDLEDDTPF